jgi:leucyl aminopeptidase (aminopeptidase T)
MSALTDAARIAMVKCLAVQPEDIVLILTDEICRDIGLVFRDVALTLEAETLLLEYRSRTRDAEEPPIGVAEVMREMDVVLAPTAKSISHTEARRRASKAGARIATMPGVSAETLERCLNANVDEIAQRVREMARALHGRSEVHVTSDAGTDLRFSIEGSRVFQDTGMIRQPGDFGNLPAGKVSLAPVEGSARGNLVIDGSMFGKRRSEAPIRMRIEGGRVVPLEEAPASPELADLFDTHGEPARNLAEFGVGAHDRAVLTGSTLEDEKVLGTVHFALGSNRSLGGSVDAPVHEVGVVASPKVTVDGRTFLDAGALKL